MAILNAVTHLDYCAQNQGCNVASQQHPAWKLFSSSVCVGVTDVGDIDEDRIVCQSTYVGRNTALGMQGSRYTKSLFAGFHRCSCVTTTCSTSNLKFVISLPADVKEIVKVYAFPRS